MFGKPGRPPEDRLLRQREIYEAVSPLIERIGARRLTMRQAARAAHLSVGGLYHYFPDKKTLLLHALQVDALERECMDFQREYGHLKGRDAAYLEAFIGFMVRELRFVRPAIQAALELGSDEFWGGLDTGINLGLDGFSETVRQVVPDASDRDVRTLARSIRRVFFAGLLDRTVTPEEVEGELRALISGIPVGQRSHVGVAV